MAIEIINVGSAPNDGQGTPIRTAFQYINNNFTELNARAQTSPPATLIGIAGDVAGMYAYDSTDFYWCFQDYDGVSVIWAVLNTAGNVSVTSISSGTSNVNIATFSGPVTVGAGGVANVAVFATTGANITGALTATGNVTGNYILGNGSQLTGLPATYGNANVANYLPTYSGNLSSGNLSVTGNTVLGNVTINTNQIIDIGNNRISNVSNPVANSDVVTKSYLDTALSSGITIEDDTANTTVLAGNATTLQLYGTVNEVAVEITATNQVTFGLPDNVSVTGNVDAGNLITGGVIEATGNITTSGFFIGTFVGNVTGNFAVPGVNTQVLYNNSGNAGADSGFTYANSIVTVTGNVAAGNLTTGGQVVATGNVTGSNLNTGGRVVASGNVTGGNLTTGGILTVTGNATVGNLDSGGVASFTGNVTGGNLNTGGRVVASGNVTGNYILGNGSQLTSVTTSVLQNGTSNVAIVAPNDYVRVKVGGVANIAVFTETATYLAGILDVTGNVVSANLNSNGAVSGTTGVFSGNVSANYFTGNGSALTGIDATAIQNGTSNVRVAASGNVTVSSAGVANVLIVTSTGANIAGTLNVTGNATVGNLGATNIAGTLTTASQPNITAVGNLTSLDVTGNVSTGNVSGATGTFTNVAGTLTTAAQTNITSVGTLTSLSVTGNVSAGNLTVSTGTVSVGNIENTNANGVGNIGTSTNYFNTVFAQATSAQYADLAEYYTADADYAPGTVVIFGGEKEITITTTRADARVAGAVSTNPAYLMNAQSPGVAVALRGRIPVNVVGPVTKGDSLVTSAMPGFAESIGTDCTQGQSVFAKCLETNLEPGKKTVEAVIL